MPRAKRGGRASPRAARTSVNPKVYFACSYESYFSFGDTDREDAIPPRRMKPWAMISPFAAESNRLPGQILSYCLRTLELPYYRLFNRFFRVSLNLSSLPKWRINRSKFDFFQTAPDPFNIGCR